MNNGENDPNGQKSMDALNKSGMATTTSRWTATDEKRDWQTAQEGELFRFDRSRRRFLKLSGLTLAGLLMPFPVWQEAASDGAMPVRVDRAVAWAFQDAGVNVVTHVPATGATAFFDAYHALEESTPCYSFNEEVAFTGCPQRGSGGHPLGGRNQIPRARQGSQQRY